MSRLERLALWWIRHYESCTHFWPGFLISLAICIFIVGCFRNWPIGPVLFGIATVSIILNAGVILLIKSLQHVLKNLPDGPEKEEAHDLMIEIIKKRLKRGW